MKIFKALLLSACFAASAQAASLEQNRERWNQLSHEQRQKIILRYEHWKALPEEKRRLIVERARALQALPEERQKLIRERAQKADAAKLAPAQNPEPAKK